ncbi:nuclear transport factor 2 family protein [Candidatus Mycobacterium wuenschmannii]|uniref:Nuclear transport factor 2 family protein n=1 Tax=Candidatus Mycobacterium wuenschmannii TaxID=3027808 RepID=A0ABY8W1I4_9MYCO|nr:nuclear transport factor 2 family protein [Candidatus Mycobacterium wuenschmannii]WIM89735.1 nuclear transport factor 2 family protein [Candidatus Mycobacterium wuenschmannii]
MTDQVKISPAIDDSDLASLSYRYAAALDQRDLPALLEVFHPDATLRARPPGRGPMVLTGHRELAKLIAAVSYWQRTSHLVGQGLFHVESTRAFGEVHCVAHHFNTCAPDLLDDDVMYIRYFDTYVRADHGHWVIMKRMVSTDAQKHVKTPAG